VETDTHALSLYRVMRTVARLGILNEDATHRFALTPVGEVLACKLSAGINNDHFPDFEPPQSNRVKLVLTAKRRPIDRASMETAGPPTRHKKETPRLSPGHSRYMELTIGLVTPSAAPAPCAAPVGALVASAACT
jgi:hypothetical protein